MKIGRTMKREVFNGTASRIGNPMFDIIYDYDSRNYISPIFNPMVNLIITPLMNLTNNWYRIWN